MADPTFCSVAEVGYKAGVGKSAVSSAEAYVLAYAKGVEGFINAATHKNWSDAYAGLNVDVKFILNEIQSNLTAIYVILYDMSLFTTRIAAEDLINVLYLRAMEDLEVLKGNAFVAGA